MKSKIFKIVLPAFALVFAMTASLAFTPAENNMLEDTPVAVAYAQDPDETDCLRIQPAGCDTEGEIVCTKTILGQPVQLFKKNAGNLCNQIIFEPQP